MSELPKWIQKLKKQDDEATLMEEVPSGALAYEALEIAWAALEYSHKHGSYEAGKAIRKIQEMGR